MVTIRLAVGLRHHFEGREEIYVEADSFINAIERLRIKKDEIGIVLVNDRPISGKERRDLRLFDDDIVDIYPIFGGG
ncbi:MAG: MoaD/ThiS family protein [Deltaproteobacteria bacterium]|nr:MoaD/ThiS family protein [Candidatus Zymogenaceae bacterium]